MFDDVQLRDISPDELAALRRELAALGTRPQRRAAADRRRRVVVLAAIVLCCLGLAAWTGLLAVSLPHYYRAGGWRGAWVGFDIVLLAAFGATGWAAWRRRQVLIICLVVLATLLFCDAWFDVVLDTHTREFELSLLSAVLVELPLAVLAIAGARRLLRLTIGMVRRREGHQEPMPALWRVPLLSAAPDRPLRDLFPRPGGPAAPAGADRGQSRSLAGPGGQVLVRARMRPPSGRGAWTRRHWAAAHPEFAGEGTGEVGIAEGET